MEKARETLKISISGNERDGKIVRSVLGWNQRLKRVPCLVRAKQRNRKREMRINGGMSVFD